MTSEDQPQAETPFTKPQVRQAGWKNLGVSLIWFLVVVLLFASGLVLEVNKLCLWPEHQLRNANVLSGRWKAIEPLVGLLGSIIFLTILVGWLLPIPTAVFMVLTGRRSKTLEKFFPIPVKIERSPTATGEARAGKTGDVGVEAGERPPE